MMITKQVIIRDGIKYHVSIVPEITKEANGSLPESTALMDNIVKYSGWLFENREYDHSFITKILYLKLKNVLLEYDKDDAHDPKELEPVKKALKIMVHLLNRIRRQDYLENACTRYNVDTEADELFLDYGFELGDEDEEAESKYSFARYDAKTELIHIIPKEDRETKLHHTKWGFAIADSEAIEQHDYDLFFRLFQKYYTSLWV